MNAPVEHKWFVVEFSYATWTECTCGFRPQTEQEMWDHA